MAAAAEEQDVGRLAAEVEEQDVGRLAFDRLVAGRWVADVSAYRTSGKSMV